MKSRFFSTALFSCALLAAADKRLPQGHAEDGTISITAVILPSDQVKQAVGSDFGKAYTVLQMTVAPKGGKPLDIHLDDFLLRSESDGDRSGPMAPSQVAGAGALVITRNYAPRTGPDSPPILTSTKVESQEGTEHPELVEALKKQMLAEKTIAEPESGLLFFPLQNEKPKNLVLTWTTPDQTKLHLQFK